LGRDQHFTRSVLLEREGNGDALAVFVVEDSAPLFSGQTLGMNGQGCDKHQHPGEKDLLHSSSDMVLLIHYIFTNIPFFLFPCVCPVKKVEYAFGPPTCARDIVGLL
jgi:hypothetical protein